VVGPPLVVQVVLVVSVGDLQLEVLEELFL
jgi:hypothetical protein